MEAVDNQQYVVLGIKVKPGPMERHKLENFALDNTIDLLRSEAEKRANIPSASLGTFLNFIYYLYATLN